LRRSRSLDGASVAFVGPYGAFVTNVTVLGRRRHAVDPALLMLGALTVALVVVFVVYPLGRVLAEGFLKRGEVDFAAWVSVSTKPVYLRVVWNTLLLGTITAASTTLAGFVTAFTLVRARPWAPMALVFRGLVLLPMIAPPFALGLASILLFGRSGLITRGVFGIEADIYGLPGLSFVQFVTFFPVAHLMFEGLLRAVDPAVEEAALNLGASPGRTFRTVTLPLLVPGFAGSILLGFIESLADLGNPILIGGDFNTLAVQSWLAIVGQGSFQMGAVLSTIVLAPSLAVFVIQRSWVAKATYISVTGKPSGGRGLAIDGAARTGLQVATGALAALVLLLYLTVLAASVVTVWGGDYRPTLAHYAVAFGRGWSALSDTVVLSLGATPIAAVAGLVVAYVVVRSNVPGRDWLDFVAMLGAAVPGTVLGIGYLLAFNKAPLQLTGGWLILVAALAVRSLPTGQRAAVAALQQISPSLEEASTNLGADATATFRRIVLPLLRPALLAGMVFSFTRNMTALSSIILLASPRWKLMTKEILDLMDLGQMGAAVAYTSILITIVVAVLGLLTAAVERWGRAGATRELDISRF
jgi:iron(III) transport system permease protein